MGMGKGYAFVLETVKKNMILAQKLESEVCARLREIHKVKRMSKKQKEVSEDISKLIIANENPENWENNIKKYCKTPIDHNQERIKEIQDLACEHQVDYYLASVLYASRCNDKHEEDK